MCDCDYSVHSVESRPAEVGDKLVTTRFEQTFTCGFAVVGDPNVAVYLLPGTEIAFDHNIEYDRIFGRRTGQRLARFQRVNLELPAHHDALEFPDGKIVLLAKLRPGQHATVLQLPTAQEPEAVRERAAETHTAGI